jgi:hypothetical protein
MKDTQIKVNIIELLHKIARRGADVLGESIGLLTCKLKSNLTVFCLWSSRVFGYVASLIRSVNKDKP